MIMVKLKGGLGNQMFQYATGLFLASKNNEELKLDVTGYEDPRHANSDTPRKYRMYAFNLSGNVATSEEAFKARNPYGIFSKGLRFFNQRILKKYYKDYDSKFLKKSHKYVEGYFQSEKNFLPIADKIRREFTIKNESEDFHVEKNKIDKTKSVSVHIRRGDYVNDKATSNYFGLYSKEYYEKAMALMELKIEAPIFYFFSDDINWVKGEFGEQSNFNFISNTKLEDYEELMLMASCSHNIIANSSFSWWGAWLNPNPNKLVIALKKWVNANPDPHLNIIPEVWTRL